MAKPTWGVALTASRGSVAACLLLLALCSHAARTEEEAAFDFLPCPPADNVDDMIATVSLTNCTSLDAQGHSIGAGGGRDLQRLLEALHGNAHVDQLDLSWADVDAASAHHIPAALGKTSLRSLSLEGNRIGADGARSLSTALGKDSMISVLEIQHNKIGASGAEALAEALLSNVALRSLDLYDNDLGQDGAVAIIGALKNHPGLVRLNLRFNRIGDVGAQAVADLLLHRVANKLPCLSHVNLAVNRITAAGALPLLAAAQACKSLVDLRLGLNDIADDEKVLKQLTDVCAANAANSEAE